jgi:hypothetical protein
MRTTCMTFWSRTRAGPPSRSSGKPARICCYPSGHAVSWPDASMGSGGRLQLFPRSELAVALQRKGYRCRKTFL